MDYHHGYSRNETPRRVSLMRGLTVLTFLGIFIPWQQITSDGTTSMTSTLTDTQIAQAEGMATAILNRSRAAGMDYSLEQFAADFSAIAGLSEALPKFGGVVPGIAAPARSDYRVVRLVKLVEYTQETIRSTSENNLAMKGSTDAFRQCASAVNDFRAQHGGKNLWPSFFPPDPTPPFKINWRTVTKRGIDAWLLAMIPAFLTILLSFRLRRESLLAELAERPWWPVLSTVAWPFGLWGYVGQPGIIERRLQALVREYQHEHHADPSQEWLAAQRLIQMRRARDLQQAMAKLAEYPELIQVTSRRAIFTSWVIAMLAGPVNLMVGVVQAYANVARVNGGRDSTQVDSTRTPRRRDVSGRAFGVMTYNGDWGFNLGTLWGIITMKNGRITGDAWVDLQQPVVMQASATVTMTEEIGLEAGRIWTPVGYSLPGPDNGLFPASSLGSHFPAAAGDGVALHATTTRASLVASAQSSTVPNRTDVSLFAKGQAGPLKIYGGAQTGSQHFRFGQFEATWLGLLLREMVVENLDRRTAAASTDLVYQRGGYRGGLHLEHDRWQLSLERRLDPHSRAVIHLGQIDGVAGTQITGKVQYGFALAP